MTMTLMQSSLFRKLESMYNYDAIFESMTTLKEGQDLQVILAAREHQLNTNDDDMSINDQLLRIISSQGKADVYKKKITEVYELQRIDLIDSRQLIRRQEDEIVNLRTQIQKGNGPDRSPFLRTQNFRGARIGSDCRTSMLPTTPIKRFSVSGRPSTSSIASSTFQASHSLLKEYDLTIDSLGPVSASPLIFVSGEIKGPSLPHMWRREPHMMCESYHRANQCILSLAIQIGGWVMTCSFSGFVVAFNTAKQALSFSTQCHEYLLRLPWDIHLLKYPGYKAVVEQRSIEKHITVWKGLRVGMAMHISTLKMTRYVIISYFLSYELLLLIKTQSDPIPIQ